MPAPIDPAAMIGRRYGALLIIGFDGRETWGGKTMPVYLCRCDCGAEQRVHHYRLTGAKARGALIRACDACRYRRECVICGKVWKSQQYKTTCSDACRKERTRRVQLESYYRRKAADPDLDRRKHQRKKELMAQNPDLAALHQLKEQMRSRRRRERMTEADREQERIRRREQYAARSEEIQARRREIWESLPPEERARRIERERELYRQRWERDREEINRRRAEIRARDPEAWNAYTRMRWQERQKARAAAEMAEIARKLAEKLDPAD